MSRAGGEVLVHISVRGPAAKQGITFRIPTSGHSFIFVQMSSTTGSITVILTPQRRRRPFPLCKCDSNRTKGSISTFFSDRFPTNFQGRAQSFSRNSSTGYFLRMCCSRTEYRFQVYDSRTEPTTYTNQVTPLNCCIDKYLI